MEHPYKLGKKQWKLIREIQEQGYTNSEFADEIDITPNGLYNILTGRSRPSIDMAYEIAKKLNRSIEYLFFERAL